MSLCYKKEGYEKRVKGETIGLPMKEGYAKRAKGKPLVFARRKDMRSEQRGNHWPSHEGRSNKETIGLPTKEGVIRKPLAFPRRKGVRGKPLVSPYHWFPPTKTSLILLIFYDELFYAYFYAFPHFE
jgi:hypothetical protein